MLLSGLFYAIFRMEKTSRVDWSPKKRSAAITLKGESYSYREIAKKIDRLLHLYNSRELKRNTSDSDSFSSSTTQALPLLDFAGDVGDQNSIIGKDCTTEVEACTSAVLVATFPQHPAPWHSYLRHFCRPAETQARCVTDDSCTVEPEASISALTFNSNF